MQSVTTKTQTSPVKRLEQHLYILTEVQRKQNEYIKVKYNVNSLEMEIIQFIVLNGKKKMKEIGEHFRIKLSTLTSTIDKIERQKLVKRVNSKNDRRVVYLEATSKGTKIYEDYFEYLKSVSQIMEENLEKDQMRALVIGIEAMSRLTKI